MIDFSKIKLIIWDLDDTFWKGTISEGSVELIEENIEAIKSLNDIGIVNSINSKNSFDIVKEFMENNRNIWDEFVFPSVNWEPKGKRLKEQIAQMGLRETNVLFLDDNNSNREEALFYCPDIKVESPDIIPQLIEYVKGLPVKSNKRERLNQYKVLEKKNLAKSTTSSNEEFLFNSNIHIEIKNDCDAVLERLHEIIIRTNQLNYTKNRISIEELKNLLSDTLVSCGYVIASDKYGEYGIVGFYAVKNNTLLQFAFSCRTMGMGIEQYVYNYLNKPSLTVVGDVAYPIEKNKETPWINNSGEKTKIESKQYVSNNGRFLIKGPCDMSQLLSYINGDIFDVEFTYINEETGVSIESYNTTTNMAEAIRLSEQEQKQVINELPFTSDLFYSRKFLSDKYNGVFVSMFSEPNLAIYKRKNTNQLFAFGEYCYDLTDENNWDLYINREIFTANCPFTPEDLKSFAENYEYIGQITPEKVLENIKIIREKMPINTTLIIILPTTLEYENNTQKAYVDRHIYHKRLNQVITDWAEKENNVKIISYDKFVTTQNHFFGNINHFIKPVYYDMAQDIIQLILKLTPQAQISKRSVLYLIKTYLRQKSRFVGLLAKLKHKLFD